MLLRHHYPRYLPASLKEALNREITLLNNFRENANEQNLGKDEDKLIQQMEVSKECMMFGRQQIRLPYVSNKIGQQEKPGIFWSVLKEG